jgi:hypothetical protein
MWMDCRPTLGMQRGLRPLAKRDVDVLTVGKTYIHHMACQHPYSIFELYHTALELPLTTKTIPNKNRSNLNNTTIQTVTIPIRNPVCKCSVCTASLSNGLERQAPHGASTQMQKNGSLGREGAG